MIEAAMIWNEPNNKSHWDPEIDPEWRRFSDMARLASLAIAAENAALPRVLGGISPIDPSFLERLERQRALDHIDVIAVHGFPLDWNLWLIDEWPQKLREIEAFSTRPVWVTEVGVSSFGAEEVQSWGVDRTAELLVGRAPRIHWYSLYDLPRTWEATTRHKEAEGSSYYRHFHMGLLREDGSPKQALERFARHTPALGICQWFHYRDHRLHEAVAWLKRLGVRHVRTGLSWADSFRPDALRWFDEQMEALADFDVTLTFCFTPEHLGIAPHHTSPPREPEAFAEFCGAMTRRYAAERRAAVGVQSADVQSAASGAVGVQSGAGAAVGVQTRVSDAVGVHMAAASGGVDVQAIDAAAAVVGVQTSGVHTAPADVGVQTSGGNAAVKVA